MSDEVWVQLRVGSFAQISAIEACNTILWGDGETRRVIMKAVNSMLVSKRAATSHRALC